MTERNIGPGETERGRDSLARWEWMVQVADLLADATEDDIADLASLLVEVAPGERRDLRTSLEEMLRGEGELVRERPTAVPPRAGPLDRARVLTGRVFEVVSDAAGWVESWAETLAFIVVGMHRGLSRLDEGVAASDERARTSATLAEVRAMRGAGWGDALDAAGVTQEDVDEVPVEDVAYWAGYNAAMQNVPGSTLVPSPVDDPMPVVQGFLEPIFADLIDEHGSVSRALNALARLVYGRHDRRAQGRRGVWQPKARPGRRMRVRGQQSDTNQALARIVADAAADRKRNFPRTVWFPAAMPGELDDLYRRRKPVGEAALADAARSTGSGLDDVMGDIQAGWTSDDWRLSDAFTEFFRGELARLEEARRARAESDAAVAASFPGDVPLEGEALRRALFEARQSGDPDAVRQVLLANRLTR